MNARALLFCCFLLLFGSGCQFGEGGVDVRQDTVAPGERGADAQQGEVAPGERQDDERQGGGALDGREADALRDGIALGERAADERRDEVTLGGGVADARRDRVDLGDRKTDALRGGVALSDREAGERQDRVAIGDSGAVAHLDGVGAGGDAQEVGAGGLPVAPLDSTLKVLSYNTYYVFAEGKQVEAATDWISQQAPDVVALQELTNISAGRLTELAAGWGHRHSALLKTSGFSVGLTSSLPIEVVDRMLDGLHHGCLHVRVDGIHVFVVHLSPFEWEKRTREAEALLAKIKPLLGRGEEVLVLGDFNALSSADREIMEAQPATLEKARSSDAKHDHVMNLRDGAFDYSVMQRFFEAGLEDAALPFLDQSTELRWTFTTGIWDEGNEAPPEVGIRIDFILANPKLAGSAVFAHVVRQGIVNLTSDHYPVIVEFRRAIVR